MKRIGSSIFVGLTVLVLLANCLWLRMQLTESNRIIKEYEALLSDRLEGQDKGKEKQE
jgi:hypothetical protein